MWSVVEGRHVLWSVVEGRHVLWSVVEGRHVLIICVLYCKYIHLMQ